MSIFKKFLADESGATAIEYGLVAALISIGVIAASSSLGNTVSNTFNDVTTAVDEAGEGNFDN